jgi:dienelactone hydrolase
MGKPPAWVAAWLVCGFSAIAAGLIQEPAFHLEYLRLVNRRGERLRVVVYVPASLSGRAPGVVLTQPLNDPPEYARPLALELVRNGFVVLSFDWRGRGAAENRQLLREHTQETLRADVAAAIAALRARSEVDPQRLVIAGHSVGGTLAIDAADNDLSLRAAAVIGMEADVMPAIPKNVLWAVGLYDEFRPLGHMREVFQASAATRDDEGVTAGDFARGTARRLAVSATADHFNELQDWGVERSVVNWFRAVLAMGPDTEFYWMEFRALAVMLAWFAGLGGALLTLRRFWGGRTWVLRAAAIAMLAAIWLVSRYRGETFLAATDTILMLFLFALLAGFIAQRQAGSLTRGARFVVRLGVVVWSSILLTLAINNFPYYFEHATYALMLPEFAVKTLLDLADAYLLDYGRPLFFFAYGPDTLAPHFWVYLVAVAEAIRPGVLLGLVARIAQWKPTPAPPTVPAPQAATSRQPAKAGPRPIVSAIVLAILGLFFCGVIWLRLEQGFLTPESARAGLRFLLRYAVPPFFIFPFLWKWTMKRNM